ncbi:MAG TPA: Smr/MutS family protein [Dongiaceae bacterium]|jgi:DNA-nicking Smr family endonuclease|nr:Smr/MutS family protein [Dongiaceae bacterium]
MSRDDDPAWQAVKRTARPLRGRSMRKAPRKPSTPPSSPVPAAPVIAPAPVPAPVMQRPEDPAGGLTIRQRRELRRGAVALARRLDLHGLTQNEAHDALSKFIRTAHAEGARTLLVITGKGARTGGILRSQVPRWLNEPALRPLILAIQESAPRHGGAGALYILLRKKR